MTLRDLQPDQVVALKKAADEGYKLRHKLWRNNTPAQQEIYERAFSDGVRATLELFGDKKGS
jgi:hypothetical protein